MGKNLEESRFFFADAAITEMCNQLADGEFEEMQNNVVKYLKGAHKAIRGIVREYMKKRNIAYKFME